LTTVPFKQTYLAGYLWFVAGPFDDIHVQLYVKIVRPALIAIAYDGRSGLLNRTSNQAKDYALWVYVLSTLMLYQYVISGFGMIKFFTYVV
jgi:hypothetical protein